MFQRPRLLLAVLAAACLVPACGSGARAPIEAEAPVLELLARPELRRVLLDSATAPVREDLTKPRAAGRDLYGALPALEFAPPVRLAFDLPASYPESMLELSFAVKRRNYVGDARITFEVTLDGTPLLEHTLSASNELPADARRWYPFSLPVGAGGELVIDATWEGDAPAAPVVAIGELRVMVPFEVERRGADSSGRNVVLIVIDTLRGDRLHVAGNPAQVSPNLDELAAQGMRFERAYSAAAWTVPSTASVLSGMSPPAHGVGFGASYYLADSILTVAEAFQRAGFTTGGFACNPLIAAARGFHRGFETFADTSWSRADVVYDEVASFLRAARDERFFLYLHYVEPHYPYEPTAAGSAGVVGPKPDGYLELELDKYLPGFYADPASDPGPLFATRDHQLELYDAEIADVDREIGRVFALLSELGLSDSTVIAVTSDHGEEFLEHGWAGHHNQLFDGSTRVPLILAGPGVPAGVVVQEPVENRLVASSVLALAGVEPTENLRGPNLAEPAGLEKVTREPVFITNTKGRVADLEGRELRELGQQHSVVHEGWRLVWSQGGAADGVSDHFALFDLRADPGCQRDVSSGHPGRVDALRDLTQRWITENMARQPAQMGATDATRELLIDIGYVSGD